MDEQVSTAVTPLVYSGRIRGPTRIVLNKGTWFSSVRILRITPLRLPPPFLQVRANNNLPF
jgi:hypothetical protein